MSRPAPFWAQTGADVLLADGPADLAALLPHAGSVVVVDVLSFSTCVSVVVSGAGPAAAGGRVLPLPWRDERAAQAAAAAGARLAGPRSHEQPSLSPGSLLALEPDCLLALPSPNGSAAVLLADGAGRPVAVGAARNAGATAAWAASAPGPVLLVAAGERWPDGRLRPALEDRWGAGLIAGLLAAAGLRLSAEAAAAAALALSGPSGNAADRTALADSASARELEALGFGADVRLAMEVDADPFACLLQPDGTIGRGPAVDQR